jgi:hypothetical protein
MKSPDPACQRCGARVPSILSGPPDGRDQWWRNVVGMRRREVTWTLRLRLFRRRWLPANPRDQVHETYTEFDLCDDCGRAVWVFAYTKVDGRPARAHGSSRG